MTPKEMSVAEMAKYLRMTPQQVKQSGMRRVADSEARELLGLPKRSAKSPGDYTGIAFAGYDLHGKKRGVAQVRRDEPDIVNGKETNKWMSPKGKQNRFLNTTPGALRSKDVLIRVESIKSVLAIAASAQRVGRKHIKIFATNGLDGWLVRDENEEPALTFSSDKWPKDKKESYPNPDLLLLAGHDVIDIPDSNSTRVDLRSKVERFQVHVLTEVHVKSLRTVRLPPKINGPDDFIAKYDDKAFWEAFDAARPAWEEAFPPASDFADLKLAADLLVDHIIANKAITVLAAPSEHYKTMFALALCLALLTGDLAFKYFKVLQKVESVIYCCPDMSFELLLQYARLFGLDKLPNFHLRTMKQGELLGVDHPLLQAAARDGSFVVLDTLNYFTNLPAYKDQQRQSFDDNDPIALGSFMTRLRTLLDVCGSPGALVLAHPTKSGVRSAEVDLTEWVSGTYAKIGTVDTIFCLKKVTLEDAGRTPYAVWVSREKSRPFLGVRCDPFTLTLFDQQGSVFDRGEFPIHHEPGHAPTLRELSPPKKKGGRPPDPQQGEKVRWWVRQLKVIPKPAERLAAMNKTFNSSHDEGTVRRWLREHATNVKQDKELDQLAEQEKTK